MLIQRGHKGRSPKTAAVPPKPTEKELNNTFTKSNWKRMQTEETEDCRENDKSEDSKDRVGTEYKQNKVGALIGMFQKAPTDQVSTFSSVNMSEPDTERSWETPANETPETKQSLHSELDVHSENNKTKGKGLFHGMFRKSPKPTEGIEDKQSLHSELSDSNDSLSDNRNTKEKGGLFSGLVKKIPKAAGDGPLAKKLLSPSDLSASSDSLSENNTKEKGGIFSGMFRKSPKPFEDAETEEDNQTAQSELSASSDSLSDNTTTKGKGGMFAGMLEGSLPRTLRACSQRRTHSHYPVTSQTAITFRLRQEKGGLFSGLLKKIPKAAGDRPPSQDQEPGSELSASNDSLTETTNTKEKGGLFSGLLKKPKVPEEDTPAQDQEQSELSASNDSLAEKSDKKEKRGLFSDMFKKSTPHAECSQPSEEEKQSSPLSDLSASSDSLSENNTKDIRGLFSGLLRKPKVPEEDTPAQDNMSANRKLSASSDSLSDNNNTKEKHIFSGMFKKAQKTSEGSKSEEASNLGLDNNLSSSYDNLLENTDTKKTGALSGMFKKSPRPAQRSTAAKDPLTENMELSASCDSLAENISAEDNLSGCGELSASNDSLSNATATKEKKLLGGIFSRKPKPVEQQDSMDTEPPGGGGQLRRKRTIKKKRRVLSFRVKRTLPRVPKSTLAAQSDDCVPIIEESVEMQEMSALQVSTVEIQPAEMSAYPTEGNPLESEEENDGLMDWWRTVEGWETWNETSDFKEEDEEMAVEQVADRVFMGARLFVRLFNQRGASLQQQILGLLAQADAADQFHKKTVQAAVGGGVASVAGSIATITGLILTPFTFGASIIVTAVGIGVATAGSIASATANITDTVHSNMDRKKVEKMIQTYQDDIKDIRECLEFVQEGMDTLQEWDFEKYTESVAKKALNQNVKHVMKEGGRAGKQLLINTDKLISTVQVLGAAGGAAQAAKAISATTGVMSALFLVLDVFFLAKDSHELRKGAKTKFASKIREVCKDLQDRLLELNKVKTQLQKTIDGIELEEIEEEEEVEVEVEDDLESDPVKLAQLDQELDLLEEKLDKKVQDENTEKSKKKEEEEKNKKVEEEKSKKKEEEMNKKEEEKSKKEEEKNKKEEEKRSEGKVKESKKEKEKERVHQNETIELEKSHEIEKEEDKKGSRIKNKISVKDEKSSSAEARKEGSERGGNNDQHVGYNTKMESKKEHAKHSVGKAVVVGEKRNEKEKEIDRKPVDARIGILDQKGDAEKGYNVTVTDKQGVKKSKKQEVVRGEARRHGSRSENPDIGTFDANTDRRDIKKLSHKDTSVTEREILPKRQLEERGFRDRRAEMSRTTNEEYRQQSKREPERRILTEEIVVSKKGVTETSTVRATRKEEDTQRENVKGRLGSQREKREGDHRRKIESVRGFQSGGQSGVRNEDGEMWMKERDRRASEREQDPARRGSRPRSKVILNDGLDI
ncbi:uncharacterized protein si:rp71-1g18.13 isoform X2 [Hypomesus transpacificus]|uniref:uncharacterized protein si:rp71-1g18.13 isoform X2 n=1 Tax=Hypomesus transpacificus TaxID=137520 RepID=UPI001F081273|nr:uncharacterized protein si:rp71-1g18.13 isoform X2 [Hypomesus transpacificus]